MQRIEGEGSVDVRTSEGNTASGNSLVYLAETEKATLVGDVSVSDGKSSMQEESEKEKERRQTVGVKEMCDASTSTGNFVKMWADMPFQFEDYSSASQILVKRSQDQTSISPKKKAKPPVAASVESSDAAEARALATDQAAIREAYAREQARATEEAREQARATEEEILRIGNAALTRRLSTEEEIPRGREKKRCAATRAPSSTFSEAWRVARRASSSLSCSRSRAAARLAERGVNAVGFHLLLDRAARQARRRTPIESAVESVSVAIVVSSCTRSFPPTLLLPTPTSSTRIH